MVPVRIILAALCLVVFVDCQKKKGSQISYPQSPFLKGGKRRDIVHQTHRNNNRGRGQVDRTERNDNNGRGQVDRTERKGNRATGQVDRTERNDNNGRGQVDRTERNDNNGRGQVDRTERTDNRGRGLVDRTQRNDNRGRGLADRTERKGNRARSWREANRARWPGHKGGQVDGHSDNHDHGGGGHKHVLGIKLPRGNGRGVGGLCEGQQYAGRTHICCGGTVKRRQGMRPACCGTRVFDFVFDLCCQGKVTKRTVNRPAC